MGELGKSQGWAVIRNLLGFIVLLAIVAGIVVSFVGRNGEEPTILWDPWGKNLVVLLIFVIFTVIVHLVIRWWAGSTPMASRETPQTAEPVSSVAPTQGAANAPVTANIEATFPEAMNPSTITADTFFLVRQATNVRVPTASPTYDPASKKATLRPSAPLDPGVTYIATVAGGVNGVKNLAGNALAADKKWLFATIPAPATQPPAVSGISNVTPTEGSANVPIDTKIEVTFSDDMEPSTITASIFFLVEQGTNVPVSTAPPTYDPASKKATLALNDTLKLGAIYTATVMSGVKRKGTGTTIAADKKWSFATAPPATLAPSSPKVGSVEPTEEGVSVTANIEATFSEAIDPSTICRSSAFELVRKNRNGKPTSVDAVVNYDSANNKAILDPNAPLTLGATYTATIKTGTAGAKNLAGNPLAAEKDWSFTTARNLGFWGLFVGQDQRGSLSKTQVVVWTYVFAFALLWIAIWQRENFGETWNNLQPEYLILLGSPAAAALLAKKFTSDHVEEQTVVQSEATQPPTPGTVAKEQITTNDGQADLFNFQYALFNLLAIGFFFSQFLPNPEEGLPHLPETLVALTGLSAAGYAAKKGWETHGMPAIYSVTPNLIFFGMEDEQITITGVNFGDQDKDYPRQNNVLLDGRLLRTVSYWDSQRIVATIPRDPAELGITLKPGDAPKSANLEVQDRFGRKSTPATVVQVAMISTPTVRSVTPEGELTSMPTNVVATFSEAMDRSTITPSTFTLVKDNADGTTAPVPAPVNYDETTYTATLTPPPPLNANTRHTATVIGGLSGVKNAAGRSLAANKTWQFRTPEV